MGQCRCAKVTTVVRLVWGVNPKVEHNGVAGELFLEAGLVPGLKLLGASSKTLSFTKPLRSGQAKTASAIA